MQSEEKKTTLNAIPYVKVEPNISTVLGLGHYIEWALHPKFKGFGDFIFFVEKSPAASGPWEVVSQVVNQLFAYDNTGEVGYRPDLNWYYRIRLKLVTPDNQEKWYLSDIVSSNAYWWEKRDYLLAKEIIRRELLKMERGSGNKGWLLKRKTFGQLCPTCLDPATNEATDGSCPDCFGTSYLGGYYAPVPFWVEFGPEQIVRKIGEMGMINQVISQARVVSFPVVDSNDAWMNSTSGQIYKFDTTIANVANVRNIPIIKSVQLSPVGKDDILYSYGKPE